MEQTIKILDLFAGAGGLSHGFQKVKNKRGNPTFELFRAVEIDKWACETLRSNYGKERVIEGDITKKALRKQIIEECKGSVDIIMGGIPCQSFSLIGPRSGYGKNNNEKDSRDDLYKEFIKITKELLPKVVVIENVKGILSKKNKSGKLVIETIIRNFEKAGYHFENSEGKKHMILNAADYGVPQIRERVIMVGILSSWSKKKMKVPERTHFPKEVTEKLKKKHHITVMEAIGDLPELGAKITPTGLSLKEIEEMKKVNERVFSGNDRMDFHKDQFRNHIENIEESGTEFFEFVRPNGYPHTLYHTSRSHKKTDIELFDSLEPGETAGQFMERCPQEASRLISYDLSSFKDKYRRQRTNAPSTTIFAHLEKDGNRFIHPTQARSLTPREAARIQSFPDDFKFEGPMTKKFRQIGNAVPPLLSKVLATEIKQLFR